MLAACHDKGALESSRVEYARVDGRRFEVRVAPADAEGEFRMLVVRATIVLDPNPEADAAAPRTWRARSWNGVAGGAEKVWRTC